MLPLSSLASPQCHSSPSNHRLQSAGCVGCAILQQADRQRPACADPSVSLSLHLHQMKRRIINIISVAARSCSARTVVTCLSCYMPHFSLLPQSLHFHLFVVARRRTGQCSYCWRRVLTTPATTVIHSRPAW